MEKSAVQSIHAPKATLVVISPAVSLPFLLAKVELSRENSVQIGRRNLFSAIALWNNHRK